MSLHLGTLLLVLGCASQVAAQGLTAQASATDLRFRFAYLARGIEGPCGADWYAHDAGERVCFRRSTVDDTFEVVRSDPLPAALAGLSPIRGPVAGDRRILFAQLPLSMATPVRAYDPVTDQVELIGNLPGGLGAGYPRGLLHFDGDGIQELLTTDGIATRIVSLPGAPGGAFQTLSTISTPPWQSTVPFFGQIDADPQTELAGRVGGQLRFFDPVTQQVEGLAPAVSMADYHYVGDWDGDGVDEVAMPGPDRFNLIDPNRSPAVYTSATTTPPFSVDTMARVDWVGAGSHQIATRGRFGYKVFDPRSGAILADFPYEDVLAGQPLIGLDWEGDGDGDLTFLRADDAVVLLRNPEGPQVVQRLAQSKLPLGHLDWHGRDVLAAVEVFGTNPFDQRLRLRDALTLERLADVALGQHGLLFPQFALGDFHPRPGAEVLVGSAEALRAYGVADGALLWTRAHAAGSSRQFGQIALAEGGCSKAPLACQRVVVAEGGVPGSSDTLGARVLLLDGADGQTLWSGPANGCPGCRNGAVAYTDLDGDGDRELLHSAQGAGGDSFVQALDGVSATPLWERRVPLEMTQFARTSDRARRLAAIDVTRTFSYLDPGTGEVLRTRVLFDGFGSTSCFNRCQLSYLQQGEAAGLWLVQDADSGVLHLAPRDLRGALAHATPEGLGQVTRGTGEIVSGSRVGLTRYAVAPDVLFADEFEGW